MTYLSTILADTPLHYWRLADGASAIFHDLGSSPKHLVNSNSPLWGGYSGIAPLAGSGYAGVGLAEYSAGLATPIPCTFEIWLYLMESTGVQGSVMVQNGNGGGNQIGLFSDGGNTISWLVGAVGQVSPLAYADQTWHHLVGTIDTANQRLYVDGTQVATVAHGAAQPSTLGLFLGRAQNNSSFCRGFVSEAAIYSVALSAAKVAAHYAAAGPLHAPVGGLTGGTFDGTTGTAVQQGDALSGLAAFVSQTYQNSV